MTWHVQLHPKALAELETLDRAAQRRMAKAIDALAIDPLHKRPGADIRRIGTLPEGTLHRIRVGTRRSLYAVVTSDRRVTVLLIDDRGRGYDRMKDTALQRAKKGT